MDHVNGEVRVTLPPGETVSAIQTERPSVIPLESHAERQTALGTTESTIAALETVRSQLQGVPDMQMPAGLSKKSGPEGKTTGEEKPTYAGKLVAAVQEGFAYWAYMYLGKLTPSFIMNQVPVYRAVEREYAGVGNNRGGVSEWTIGYQAKAHALNWVKEHQRNPREVVAIKSTFGELKKQGNAEVMGYGGYHSPQRKVVLHHNSDVPIKHTVIRSNHVR